MGENKKKRQPKVFFDVQDFSNATSNPQHAITNGKQGGGYESHLPCHRHSELPQVVTLTWPQLHFGLASRALQRLQAHWHLEEDGFWLGKMTQKT